MEFETDTNTGPGFARALWNGLQIAALVVAAGYVGTLWQLSQDQRAQLDTIRIERAQKTIDCAAAELVATCQQGDPFAKCAATAEAAK